MWGGGAQEGAGVRVGGGDRYVDMLIFVKVYITGW